MVQSAAKAPAAQWDSAALFRTHREMDVYKCVLAHAPQTESISNSISILRFHNSMFSKLTGAR